jgi:hypothetical protein
MDLMDSLVVERMGVSSLGGWERSLVDSRRRAFMMDVMEVTGF